MFDYKESQKEPYFDTYDVIRDDDDNEKYPSRFAAELLMPPKLFEDGYKNLSNSKCSESDIVEHLMYNFGVNKKSVLKRYGELQIGKAGVHT